MYGNIRTASFFPFFRCTNVAVVVEVLLGLRCILMTKIQLVVLLLVLLVLLLLLLLVVMLLLRLWRLLLRI